MVIVTQMNRFQTIFVWREDIKVRKEKRNAQKGHNATKKMVQWEKQKIRFNSLQRRADCKLC